MCNHVENPFQFKDLCITEVELNTITSASNINDSLQIAKRKGNRRHNIMPMETPVIYCDETSKYYIKYSNNIRTYLFNNREVIPDTECSEEEASTVHFTVHTSVHTSVHSTQYTDHSTLHGKVFAFD